ncbi:MAG TPA: hypothetical protein VEI54_13165 [Candidatus Limnocylindrales bacterium]|nr:hypothetical protein [Candidatus Limnocylindrales bacterium]
MATKTKSRHTFARHVAPFAPLAMAMLMHTASPGGGGTAETPPTEATEVSPGFSQMCSSPHFPAGGAPTSIDQTSCTLAGNGGAETWQNEAKNNFCAAGPSRPITIAEMVDMQTKVQQDGNIPFGNTHNHPLTATPGPATDRKPLQAMGEGTIVSLEGYVKLARQEGAESVNCGSNVANIASNHDIHIAIVDSPGADECSGVVVEMVPHYRPASWTPANVNAVGSANLRVRVTGQLMFDSSHTPCRNGTSIQGDPKRSSLWEVHPIYQFDVCPQGSCNGGVGWVPLEQFAAK